MEAIMAIGVGYVFMLTPAIIVFLVLRAQQNSLEKRLDELVQMSRISGEVFGVDEICQSFINLRGVGQFTKLGRHFCHHSAGNMCSQPFGWWGASFTDLGYHRCFRPWRAAGGPTLVS